ncbi:MAG: cupin domain-containing protein [Thermoplasmata archaeon]|nr:cupin domain-containing protein [Thermoplasmata archaeon]
MDEIFIKKGEEKYKAEEPGKLFRLLIKSRRMEAVIAEMGIGVESKMYKHEGEEMHLLLKGKIEYRVGEKTYTLEEGDILWHRSNIPHGAKNIGDEKAVYLTVGSPPTFM